MNLRRFKTKGFGLIALMIAVAIIAILGGGKLYFDSAQNKKSSIELGKEAEKKAQDAVDLINNRNPETGNIEKTSDWKTYRNEKYGFEMKYPNDLTKQYTISVNELAREFEKIFKVTLEDIVSISTESRDSSFNIDVISGRTLNDFLSFEAKREIIDTWYYDQTPPKLIKEFMIFGKKAVLQRGPGMLSTHSTSRAMIEIKKNQIIRISFVAEMSYEAIESLLEQILSTFRFLE